MDQPSADSPRQGPAGPKESSRNGRDAGFSDFPGMVQEWEEDFSPTREPKMIFRRLNTVIITERHLGFFPERYNRVRKIPRRAGYDFPDSLRSWIDPAYREAQKISASNRIDLLGFEPDWNYLEQYECRVLIQRLVEILDQPTPSHR